MQHRILPGRGRGGRKRRMSSGSGRLVATASSKAGRNAVKPPMTRSMRRCGECASIPTVAADKSKTPISVQTPSRTPEPAPSNNTSRTTVTSSSSGRLTNSRFICGSRRNDTLSAELDGRPPRCKDARTPDQRLLRGEIMQPTDENVIERRRRANISAYKRWQQGEGIPIYNGSYVTDLHTLEVAPWARTGQKGAFVNLAYQEIDDGQLLEIAGGGQTTVQRHLFESLIYV